MWRENEGLAIMAKMATSGNAENQLNGGNQRRHGERRGQLASSGVMAMAKMCKMVINVA
jgi:hypothetical protein